MSLTDALLAGCVALLSFSLVRLWILAGDMRAVKVALTGIAGDNGLVSEMRECQRDIARNSLAIARLQSRAGLGTTDES